MEPLIFLLWCCLVIAIPIALIVATFVGIRRNADFIAVIGGLVIGLLVHVVAIALTFFPMFVVIYAGAHTTPPGNALDLKARLVFLSLEIFYLLIALSCCSLLAGRARPWPMRLKIMDEIP